MEPKILVVDDDPDIITVLQDRLEAQGYEILTAGDGLRALELIEQDPPRLMLLDLEMPRLNGLELLKRLAEAKGTGTASEPSASVLSDGFRRFLDLVERERSLEKARLGLVSK